MTDPDPICPCQELVHPRPASNPPGLSALSYRAGDFDSFRQALLRPMPAERALQDWQPTERGDLAVQLLEWWAYVADVLTFYNERSANEAYLRTALLPAHTRGLVRLLGYRPQPGIAATGLLGVLTSGKVPVDIPAGFAVQSKPGPGEVAQVFETDVDARALPASVIDVDVSSEGTRRATSLLLDGTVTAVRAGDELLLLPNESRAVEKAALVTVGHVAFEKSPRAAPLTRLDLSTKVQLARLDDTRLVRPLAATPLWSFHPVKRAGEVHLASLVRSIHPGDRVLLGERLVTVSTYFEAVWFANGAAGEPEKPPGGNIPAIAVPHSVLGVDAFATDDPATSIRFDFRDVGRLVPEPIRQVTASSLAVTPLGPVPASVLPGSVVLLEDADGNGVAVNVDAVSAREIRLSWSVARVLTLTAPLRLLTNLVQVSRGASVPREVLGSGDANQSGQSFSLRKSPLTYVAGAATDLGASRSTLRIWVDGIEWREVPTFFEQSPEATVFVTTEDVDQKTSVSFGDGVHGKRLPTGTNNVVAAYRVGSGARAPAVGSLTAVLRPLPGLRGVRNPVPVGAGRDPEPPDEMRRYAPQSVLALGRAISVGDFENVARQAPGVRRARAYWAFDVATQNLGTTVYVGDDVAAVQSAQLALARTTGRASAVDVILATELSVRLVLTLGRDERFEAAPIDVAVRAALCDDDVGLFGARRIGIGEAVYRSQIADACLAVSGILTARIEAIGVGDQSLTGPKYDPGKGGYLALKADDLDLRSEVVVNGR